MDDVAYFRRRAADERRASMSASSAEARAIHCTLADRYSEMAEAIAAHQVVVGENWSVELWGKTDAKVA